nr:hypothetical protein [Streptomyces sp. HNM0575]
MALFFVLFVTLGVLVTVRTVRAVQRGVERTGTQVRRTVEETALRARSAQPGTVGELARRRLELRSSIEGTRRALEADLARDPSLQEALGLLNRLHEHARQLDGEMQLLMDKEPDRARTASLMPGLRARVARIKESADSLRFAAQDRAGRHDAEGLDALSEQIEIEAGALRHWDAGGTGTYERGGRGRGLEGEIGREAEREISRECGRETGRGIEGGEGRDRGGRTEAAPRGGDAPRDAPKMRKGRPQSAA